MLISYHWYDNAHFDLNDWQNIKLIKCGLLDVLKLFFIFWWMNLFAFMHYGGLIICSLCRCILVDESDRVVGHDTKYNCKWISFSFITSEKNHRNYFFLFCHWNTCACRRCVLDNTDFLVWYAGHLMEKIEAENLLHRAFSVFLFNSKYELLLQVLSYDQPDVKMTLSFIKTVGWFLDLLASYYVPSYWNFHLLLWTATVKNKGYVPTCVDKYLL